MKNTTVFRFSLKLIIILLLVFGLHITVLNYIEAPLFDNKIVLAYVINAILAIIIFITLLLLKKNHKDQLGFIFLIGSSTKFIMFFLFFYKSYKLDSNIDTYEFAAFFIPYITCLVIETFSLSKWLNKLD